MINLRDADVRNLLFYADNLKVMSTEIDHDSVDLVYLDPPAIRRRGHHDRLDNSWHWNDEVDVLFSHILDAPESEKIASIVAASISILGESDEAAYIVMMAARLPDMFRALRPTGWLFLQVAPTISGYMRPLLDATFGPEGFRNEIVWRTPTAGVPKYSRLPVSHEIILAYGKSAAAQWNTDGLFVPFTEEQAKSQGYMPDKDGRLYRLEALTSPFGDSPDRVFEFFGVTNAWRLTKDRMQEAYELGKIVQTHPGTAPKMKRYLDESRGRALNDTWTDISTLRVTSKERLGLPSQKPLGLVSRIISAGSREGDVVLDPFAGSGTSIVAAQHLGRRWIGIEKAMSYVEIIDARLKATFGESVSDFYNIVGTPRDYASAQDLFERSRSEFERWCMLILGGEFQDASTSNTGHPNGIIRFPGDRNSKTIQAVVEVKESPINEEVLQQVAAYVDRQADFVILISFHEPSIHVREQIKKYGAIQYDDQPIDYPRIQIATVADLVAGRLPKLPTSLVPFLQTKRFNSSECSQQTSPAEPEFP